VDVGRECKVILSELVSTVKSGAACPGWVTVGLNQSLILFIHLRDRRGRKGGAVAMFTEAEFPSSRKVLGEDLKQPVPMDLLCVRPTRPNSTNIMH